MTREEYLMDVLLRPSGIADRRIDGAIEERSS